MIKLLRLENISWSTPDGAGVLKDLSITVSDGKLVVITGPNGGGKSTHSLDNNTGKNILIPFLDFRIINLK